MNRQMQTFVDHPGGSHTAHYLRVDVILWLLLHILSVNKVKKIS